MLIQDRIKLIIKANNETPSSFADKIGIKRSNLSHVLNGRNNPSLDFLSKILTTFPQVNASWLVTGVTREGDFDPTKNNPEKSSNIEVSEQNTERIVVFSNDGTFREYFPSS